MSPRAGRRFGQIAPSAVMDMKSSLYNMAVFKSGWVRMSNVISNGESITPQWLSDVLQKEVTYLKMKIESSNWSSQVPLTVKFRDGKTASLRVKICVGSSFGRSEVDYYTRDYVTMADAPLVKCWNAEFDGQVGYHLLLDDLAETHSNRRDVLPSRTYGVAVAKALGRLHKHHWEALPVPDQKALDRYFHEVRPGIAALKYISGHDLYNEATALEVQLRDRLMDRRGMSLLHGDLNSMNILTPRGNDSPVFFIDRQPFDWSLTYALAIHDLAYFLVLWWPEDIRIAHEAEIVRCWHSEVDDPSYPWAQALIDWKTAVRQCLHVPLEWCSKPETAEKMRWLWELQLSRVLSAVASADEI